MIDYSVLSDFEINKKVAIIAIDYEDMSPFIPMNGTSSVQYGDGARWHHYDPCNNPSDAWPIIVENKININHMKIENCWEAFNYYHHGIDATHTNPLRAAMIVFLMMKDAEKL